jgi:hypothetical protein
MREETVRVESPIKTSKISNKIGIQEKKYPNFLYIGASKAGSSWIYQILQEHPDIFIPKAKDLQFFDIYYQKGVDWYLSFFREGQGKTAVGELSHDYFLYEEVATRIYENLPNIKLVCCLREPVDRIISAYLYSQTMYLDKKISLEEYAFQPDILKTSDYYNNLLPFYRLFPQEQILVLFYDELKQDPGAFAQKIYSFLGVDPNFDPPSVVRKVLAARKARNEFLAHIAYQTGLVFRKMGLANLVGQIKHNPLFNLVFYTKLEQKPDFPADIKNKFQVYFQQDYQKLAELIGRDLPPSWFQKF